MAKICPDCGKVHPDMARFCVSCSAKLVAVPVEAEETAVERVEVPRPSPAEPTVEKLEAPCPAPMEEKIPVPQLEPSIEKPEPPKPVFVEMPVVSQPVPTVQNAVPTPVPVMQRPEPVPIQAPETKKPASKKTIILSCIGGVVLFLAVFVAAVLIRTDIKLDDLTAKPNKITALLKFGLPRSLTADNWAYDDCITIHGVEVDAFGVDFDDDSYYLFEFDEDDQSELAELLTDECDYERTYGVYYEFAYKTLEITASEDCNYISFSP